MKFLLNLFSAICWLFAIFHLTSSTHPQSVNLVVETSFLFEPQDMEQNTTMLKSVRQFLDKLEELLSPHNREPTFRAQNVTGKKSNGNDNRLTNFLAELGIILINYDEDDVTRLAAALNDEVAKNYVTSTRFHEMFKDAFIKTFIANIVKEWTTTDPLRLKVGIAKYVTGNEGSAFVNFFRSLNHFFEFDKSKLKKLVKRFAIAKETKRFAKPVQKTFELIFNAYGKMDDDSKSKFHEELNKLTKYVVTNYKNRLETVHDNNMFRRALNYVTTIARGPSESVKEDFKSDNSIENVKVDANEIRIDKDIQLGI